MNQVATLPKRSLVNSMAARYDMEPNAFVEAIKASVIKGACSNEQFAAFLMVAKEYDLNPLTKEIYAFPDRGGIQPIVSIDGWMKLINSHPQFDGMEFDDTHEDGKLSSVTCRMYRKDRSRPISVIEYMTECARPTEPWKKWPARMLRHKAAIQAARYAFGFSGIMEPDEYDRMKDVTPAPVQTVADPFGDEPQSAKIEEAEIVAEEPETPASEPDAGEQGVPDDVAADETTDDEKNWLKTAVRMLVAATAVNGDVQVLRDQYAGLLKSSPATVRDPAVKKALETSKFLSSVMKAEVEFDQQTIADLTGLDMSDIPELPRAG